MMLSRTISVISLSSLSHGMIVPSNRSCNTLAWAVWHVALSCWNYLSLTSRKSNSCQQKLQSPNYNAHCRQWWPGQRQSQRNMSRWHQSKIHVKEWILPDALNVLESHMNWYCPKFSFIQKLMSSLKMIFQWAPLENACHTLLPSVTASVEFFRMQSQVIHA